MGSVAKVVKKVTRSIKRPISKITKGIARGIAKVGKAVIRGVGKMGKKLGPMGMIGLSIMMPMALGGLSSWIGQAGVMHPMYGMSNATGLMAKKGFLGAVGRMGNAVRTGYQFTTGKISGYARTLTQSISDVFSGVGKGNNIFSKISNGAKDLFSNARLEANKLKPFKARGGTADILWGQGPAGQYGTAAQTFTSEQAASMIQQGMIGTGSGQSQLLSQSVGKTGWLTKANKFDQLVTDTINKTYKDNVMSNWSADAIRAHGDYTQAVMGNGTNANAQEIGKMMQSNLTSSSPGQGFQSEFNFAKSGDFHLANPNEPNSYVFNGKKSFNVNGKSTLEKVKSTAKGVALDKLQKSLLTPSAHVDAFNLPITLGDMTQQTDSATMYGGTTIQGSAGGSLLEGVYNKDAQERILNYYRHMNIVGSQ